MEKVKKPSNSERDTLESDRTVQNLLEHHQSETCITGGSHTRLMIPELTIL
jgi:hypothetical protein